MATVARTTGGAGSSRCRHGQRSRIGEQPGCDGRWCHLYRPAVRPDHRRRGVASAVPATAEERFVRLGGCRGVRAGGAG
ncbi:GNAT family N-acetyltransferase [Streptomyces griseoloalbus]|uniref:GNAT family N-acetyltransferase n=1 Tax=Streptomyces griseoloalbus TaxID=67303 RepID=UPI003F53FF5E